MAPTKDLRSISLKYQKRKLDWQKYFTILKEIHVLGFYFIQDQSPPQQVPHYFAVSITHSLLRVDCISYICTILESQ